jgi:hypothetical protein
VIAISTANAKEKFAKHRAIQHVQNYSNRIHTSNVHRDVTSADVANSNSPRIDSILNENEQETSLARKKPPNSLISTLMMPVDATRKQSSPVEVSIKRV